MLQNVLDKKNDLGVLSEQYTHFELKIWSLRLKDLSKKEYVDTYLLLI